MVLTLDAVVMEMEERSASTGGSVTMETFTTAATSESGESAQRAGGSAPQERNHRILIVIGEIYTEDHLEKSRREIERGKIHRFSQKPVCSTAGFRSELQDSGLSCRIQV